MWAVAGTLSPYASLHKRVKCKQNLVVFSCTVCKWQSEFFIDGGEFKPRSVLLQRASISLPFKACHHVLQKHCHGMYVSYSGAYDQINYFL